MFGCQTRLRCVADPGLSGLAASAYSTDSDTVRLSTPRDTGTQVIPLSGTGMWEHAFGGAVPDNMTPGGRGDDAPAEIEEFT